MGASQPGAKLGWVVIPADVHRDCLGNGLVSTQGSLRLGHYIHWHVGEPGQMEAPEHSQQLGLGANWKGF